MPKFIVRLFAESLVRLNEKPYLEDDNLKSVSINLPDMTIAVFDNFLAPASWCAGSAIKRPCEPVPVTHAPEGHRPDAKRRVHRSAAQASSAAKASTPCGDQLIPWCLQRADTAQSLYFSTRVLAIHNPARCRCW